MEVVSSTQVVQDNVNRLTEPKTNLTVTRVVLMLNLKLIQVKHHLSSELVLGLYF